MVENDDRKAGGVGYAEEGERVTCCEILVIIRPNFSDLRAGRYTRWCINLSYVRPGARGMVLMCKCCGFTRKISHA